MKAEKKTLSKGCVRSSICLVWFRIRMQHKVQQWQPASERSLTNRYNLEAYNLDDLGWNVVLVYGFSSRAFTYTGIVDSSALGKVLYCSDWLLLLDDLRAYLGLGIKMAPKGATD